MNHESKVRRYYDSATQCYEAIMGDTWHHADPAAEARGLSISEACQRLEEELVERSGLRPGGWALDFGTGVGGPTLHMARVSRAHFVGVTNNELCNQKARARAEAAGLSEKVGFLTMGDMDYKHLPFADASFEAVFFYESVCHLPDKAAFFREAFRVLTPGGRLAGIDWLQRPFGARQTEAQILEVMGPVNHYICIPGHGTLAGYGRFLGDAGFDVLLARDLFEGVHCWGSTPPEQRSEWLEYEGPERELFRNGKQALDAARAAGVFTVGMFVAEKPRAGKETP
jgi:tocopherol O-methyltransferase